jgi:predicted Zn-dependent protease with MMP-like domain
MQLSEWEAYDRIDPIGTWRADFRGAKLESLILNIVNQLYAEKGKKPVVTTALDFMPDWIGDKVDDKKVSTPEDILALFRGIASTQKKKKEPNTKPPTKRAKN